MAVTATATADSSQGPARHGAYVDPTSPDHADATPSHRVRAGRAWRWRILRSVQRVSRVVAASGAAEAAVGRRHAAPPTYVDALHR